jgi:hypothetical protein
MKSISEREYMSPEARHLLELAQMAVKMLPDAMDPEGIRCHELARAVARQLQRGFVVDGTYAHVDHSWIELPISHDGYILDVYAVGRLPQVQLLQKHLLLQKQTLLYMGGHARTDLRRRVLNAMDDHLDRVFKPRMRRLEVARSKPRPA